MEYCKKDCEHMGSGEDGTAICKKFMFGIALNIAHDKYLRCKVCEEDLIKRRSQAITGFRNRGHFANYIRKIVYSIKPDCLMHPINEITWKVWEAQNTMLIQEYIRDIKWLNLEKDLSSKEWNKHIKTLRVKYGLSEKFVYNTHKSS